MLKSVAFQSQHSVSILVFLLRRAKVSLFSLSCAAIGGLKKERCFLRRAGFVPLLGYFACLLLIGVFVRDTASQPGLFSTIHGFLSTPQDMGDPVSFATGALDIYRFNWPSPGNYWLIHLWPPGFMLLEGGILKLFGEEAPFIAILMVLSSLSSAMMLSVLRRALIGFVPAAVATLLPLLPFCFPVTRQFLLQPTGLVLGEAFSVAFFITSVLLVWLAAKERNLTRAVVAGLLLALSAYFRSQYELIVVLMTACALPLALWAFIAMRRKGGEAEARTQILYSLKAVAVLLVTAHVLMAPWRIHNKVEADSLAWVQTQDLTYQYLLSTDAALLAGNGAFVIRGGGNVACALDPSVCGKSDRALILGVFVAHMREWLQIKASLLPEYWFASINDWGVPVTAAGRGDNLANGLALLCVLAIAPLLHLGRRALASDVLIWLFSSFFIFFFLVFVLIHYEVRYFYLFKIFAIVSSVLLACRAWHQMNTARNEIERSTLTPVQGLYS